MNKARMVVLAVVAGGIGADLAAGPSPAPPPPPAPIETVEILVPKSDIGRGHRLSTQDFASPVGSLSAATPQLIRKNDRPPAIDRLAGAIARTDLAAGEPIREAKFSNTNGSGFMAAWLPCGMRAISTEISPATRSGGFILPNDHVDII
jgi:pilus assembly protein CpaB